MARSRITLLLVLLFPAAIGPGLQFWSTWKLRLRSPAQTVAAMRLPDVFAVDVVAAEPDLYHPLAMTFDEHGRIWVVDSPHGYGSDTAFLPGRVKILESSRSNGTYDRVTPFPVTLHMPSAVAVGHGGVWVVDAPDILFFPVKNGVVGPRQVIVSGFGTQNTNGLPNSLTWGPDGWLYGLSSVWCENHVVHGGRDFHFSCAVFRIHPQTRDFELFAEGTSNPWGIAFDGEGSAFISTCVTDHLWHMTETGIYRRIGGDYPAFSWPIGSIVRHQHAGHSHCGIVWVDSDVFPTEYRGRLLMGNISSGDINADGLRRDGATYRGTPAPDFINCTDAWFTPVAQKIGPDGCLYILDWCDRVHCMQDMLRHPRSSDQAMGRIYRVRYGVSPDRERRRLLADCRVEELVQQLASPNVWRRETAQRLLVERNDPITRHLLSALVRDATAPRPARMHALWALIGCGALEPDLHLDLLHQSDPGLRAWAVRAAGNFHEVTPAVRDRVAALAHDPSADVRLQVAIATRKLHGLDPLPILVDTAAASAGDRLIAPIVWRNLQPLLARRGDDFLALVEKTDLHAAPGLAPILPRAVEYLMARPSQDPAKVVELFQKLTEARTMEVDPVRQVLSAMSERLQTGEIGTAQRAALEAWARPFVRKVMRTGEANPLYIEAALLASTLGEKAGIDAARQLFAAKHQSDDIRLGALAARIAGHDPTVLRDVAPVLTVRDRSTDFRGRMVTALERLDDVQVAEVVLAHYDQMEADLQPAAVNLLTQRDMWSKRLLRAVRDGKVAASALNLSQVRRLLVSKDAELVQQVRAQWGNLRSERDPKREQVVARMRTVLQQRHGNPIAGMRVFHKLCGQCHRIYGRGADVGPDLTSAGRASYDQLLTKVFDPDQFIKAGFQAVTVFTTDGRSVTGLRVEDNARRVVLKTQGGKVEILPRRAVETIAVGKMSLMPEGIEKLLQPGELADLFAFLTLDRLPGDPRARKIPGTPP